MTHSQQLPAGSRSLLHISDPHFGRERVEVVKALLALHRQLAPRLVIVSGDLTQRARPAQFDAAQAFFATLDAAATLVIPGNHDVPIYNLLARLRSPYGRYRGAFGDLLEPVYEDDQVLVIGVNTSTPRRRVDGEVNAGQVAAVVQRLGQASPDQLRIVVVHQPVAVPPGSERQRLLHGASEAVPAWVNAGADLVLGGHIHLPYVLSLPEHFAGLQRAAWVVHAGTAVSDRLRMDAPNSVNELRFDVTAGVPAVTVVRWDYCEAQERFRVEAETPLLPDRDTARQAH